MAYGFGTTVNPQLGAVDYSNYLRGALSGAQMQAQGGAAIGAGVQNALAGIGKGIQGYRQKKEEKRIMEGAQEMLKTIYNQNPEQAQALGINPGEDGEWDYKELRAAVEGAGGPKNIINLGTIINQAAIQKAEAQAEAQSRAVQDALNRAQIGKIENENRLRQETEEINKTVRDIIAANTNTEGELQTDTLLTDFINAGAPVDFALNTVSNIVKASPDNAFLANAYTVKNPNTGEAYTVVNTSKGSAQIMPPSGKEETTAFQKDISEKQKQFGNARKSYESGDVISAIQILRSLGVKSNITGNLIGPDDLEEFYGVDTSSQNLNDAGSVNYRDVAEVLNANAG